MADWLGLNGEICVVTGGGGRATGAGCAEVGAAGVALLDNNLANAQASAEKMRAQGARAIAIQCDIADAASVRDAANKVAAELGPVDVLVNAVIFLASQRARYITGQEILVDGGVSHSLMGRMPRSGFEPGGNA